MVFGASAFAVWANIPASSNKVPSHRFLFIFHAPFVGRNASLSSTFRAASAVLTRPRLAPVPPGGTAGGTRGLPFSRPPSFHDLPHWARTRGRWGHSTRHCQR